MKRFLPLIIFAAIFATVIYKRNPGVKAKVDNMVNTYGGWTEEARKKEPAKFIEHAINQLEKDKVTFNAQRVSYGAVRSEAEASLKMAETKIAKANEFAEGIKMAYTKASTASTWPVEFSGASYTEDQLVTQVSTILHEKKAHENSIGTYKAILEDIETQDTALLTRITEIDGEIIKLKASKQAVQMKKLTADADSMLSKVNDLLEGNTSTISELNSSPIRSLDDLNLGGQEAGAADDDKKAKTVANKEVMDFLSGI